MIYPNCVIKPVRITQYSHTQSYCKVWVTYTSKECVTSYEKTDYDGDQSVNGRKTIKLISQKETELSQLKVK
jgi:hypothetical protein